LTRTAALAANPAAGRDSFARAALTPGCRRL